MRRPVRTRKNKETLKEKGENNVDDGENRNPVSNSAVDNSHEKSDKCLERVVLKDQTNVLRSDQSPVTNTPALSNPIKYGLRRNNSVDYKKLSNGMYLDDDYNENKAELNTTKTVTPKSTNKIFKSVSRNKITPDIKADANNKVSPALKIKPIYNIHTNTPRPRPSMPIEKKLAVYEFEVDENEPKVKQKKKRIRKVGEKKKLKKEQNKKITAKNVAACLKNSVKNPCVRLVKLENQKKVLSTQNNSYLGNRTPAYNTVERDSFKAAQKENYSCRPFEVPTPAHNGVENVSFKTAQKKNFNCSTFEVPTSAHNGVEHDSFKAAQKENFTRRTFEVPVLFHNHQSATPAKKSTSLAKPGFTAMSDDEEMDKSQYDRLDISLFSNTKRSLEMKEKTSKSSLSHDYSYDYQINASTPVKYNYYNTTANSSSIENCFGFDEPEVFEEPLISPIKNLAESNHSGEALPTPHRFHQKQDNNSEKKEEIPVTQVIKMLKYGIDEVSNDAEIKSRSSSSSTSPIFNEPAVDDQQRNITPKEDKTEKSTKPVPRRSYERPSYLRKKNKSFEEEDSGGELEEDKGKKTFLPKKKHHGPSKKEKEEMQKWIKAFNSQCQEVEKFDLVVE